MRYFFEISYKGTNYHGWQIQQNALSVQQVLQDSLQRFTQRTTEITGSGRTDTGVHARQQFFHVDIEKEIDVQDFRYHLNAVLPKDILIKSISHVTDEAHARFDAVSRSYEYWIIPQKNPFLCGQALIYHKPLDVKLLNDACRVLLGKHDFESFSKVKTQVNNFECELFDARWERVEDKTVFHVSANRFLRGMVRALVGTLLMVNENKIDRDSLKKILESKDRKAAGKSVSPDGLYLTKIEYPAEIFIN